MCEDGPVVVQGPFDGPPWLRVPPLRGGPALLQEVGRLKQAGGDGRKEGRGKKTYLFTFLREILCRFFSPAHLCPVLLRRRDRPHHLPDPHAARGQPHAQEERAEGGTAKDR